MASPTAITVVYGFSVLLFCSLQLHGVATTRIQATQRGLERLATAAFAPSVLATLVLTPLLSFAHARAGGRRLVAGLATQTFLVATVALLSCAVVVQLGADGHLDRGRDDVARLNVK